MINSTFDDHYGFRAELRQALRRDLLGPRGGDFEILKHDAPVTAYLTGVLFPRGGPGAEIIGGGIEAPDVVHGDNVDQGVESGVAMANRRQPSSAGMTFAVDPAVAATVYVSVTAARYLPEDASGNPVDPKRGEARSVDQQDEWWRRDPVVCKEVSIDVRSPGVSGPVHLADGLELRTRIRKPGIDGSVSVTTTLINSHRVGEHDLKDAYSFFQPTIEVYGPAGTWPFVERAPNRESHDPELQLSRLLHRHSPSFAVGHGCTAVWEWIPPPIRTAGQREQAAVARLRSDFLPSHEVLLTDSNPEIDDHALGMLGLATRNRQQVVADLNALLDGYERWISDRDCELDETVESELRAVGGDQLRLCCSALARMRDGVAMLAAPHNDLVFAAFQAANRAMATQRARTAWVKAGRKGEIDLTMGKWRPFQIGFMLLSLRGIVDPFHEDRELADLLWFPTGGGKTEAYLGLIAFTTFLRRLRFDDAGAGVTVIMRYTLRLLTLQQFERATTLICAMELIRAQDKALGSEPISIGMWVGQSATPNLLKVAAKKLTELQDSPGTSLKKNNPVQLRSCPWCGEPLDAANYAVDEDAVRMFVRCPSAVCEFHRGTGLPVHLIDEAVYDAHPTLIIATVDKFAALPWNPDTLNLFNRDRRPAQPPELIVQDELHLISGPLGTLTGLYETAIDILAGQPKVIASTATIRRASDQVGALFDRRVAQFPPAGLDSRDSWFAVESPREVKASRRYVGLFSAHSSQATLLVRTYAAVLFRVFQARGIVDDKTLDAYWTLVGYFNSLRLLSAAELQIYGDVAERIKALAEGASESNDRAVGAEVLELSSRADATKISEYLKALERELPNDTVVDILLATNMISVGVDIDRLGLMAVMGQPQTTAEYIQATSRVGRKYPGFVAVMLNSARSRDRSHYESFQTFHSALYREVESTSVTPFSSRARDRGLHAVIVALTRLTLPEARDDSAAGNVANFVGAIRQAIIPEIIDRVEIVAPEEVEATRRACEEFLDWWCELAGETSNLRYRSKKGSPALLAGFMDEYEDDGDDSEQGWPTAWSLRDVDPESTLFLKSGGAQR
ncbi:helicase-related protein [Nocardia sp. NPDC058640]|uniref:helicase-related protein n=1 Tax=Nocardia sp. NPDC058640 TaxID=3346571 RepID=UPI0036681355